MARAAEWAPTSQVPSPELAEAVVDALHVLSMLLTLTCHWSAVANRSKRAAKVVGRAIRIAKLSWPGDTDRVTWKPKAFGALPLNANGLVDSGWNVMRAWIVSSHSLKKQSRRPGTNIVAI